MSFDSPLLPIAPATANPALHLWAQHMRHQLVFYLESLQNQITTVNGLLASYQPLDATLTALANLTIAANSLTIGTGTDAFSQTTFAANTFPARASTGSLAAKTISDFALTFLDDATAAAVRGTIAAPDTTISWQIGFGNRPNSATAGTLAAADGSLSDATDMDGHVVGRNMADAARTDHAFAFFVPKELDVTQAVTAIVSYRMGSAGTGAAVEIEMTARVIRSGQLAVSGGNQYDVAAAQSVNAYGAGIYVDHSLGTVFAANTLDTTNYIKGTIFRDARVGNVDDTFAGTINMLGIIFTGTRKTS